MTKEEILSKYGIIFENFCPIPNAPIKITVDTNKIDVYQASQIMKALREIYPEKTMFMTIKGALEVNG